MIQDVTILMKGSRGLRVLDGCPHVWNKPTTDFLGAKLFGSLWPFQRVALKEPSWIFCCQLDQNSRWGGLGGWCQGQIKIIKRFIDLSEAATLTWGSLHCLAPSSTGGNFTGMWTIVDIPPVHSVTANRRHRSNTCSDFRTASHQKQRQLSNRLQWYRCNFCDVECWWCCWHLWFVLVDLLLLRRWQVFVLKPLHD